MDRLEKEKRFQDKRVNKEEKRFITDVDSLLSSFFNNLINLHGKKVLELGCGTGSRTIELGRENEVIAIDISPESIKVLTKEIKKEKVNAKAVLMNAEDLKFKDNYFDVVYGIAILHHLDLEKVMSELKMVCKGNLFFIEPVSYNPIVRKYRERTPDMRTKFEHPLNSEDLKIMKKYFKVKIKGFYLLQTIMPGFARYNNSFKGFRRFLDYIDLLILFVLPSLKRYCYSWIIQLKD